MIFSLKNISLEKGKKEILSQVNLDIKPNRLTMIAGRNGAGKSSLLRILSGEEKQYQGSALFVNNELKTCKPESLATQRAVLPQHPNAGFSFTAKEIISLGAFPYRVASDIVDQHIDELANKLGVYHLLNRPLTNLSGGEQQKIHVGRVMLQSLLSNELHKVMLLDEPANNLDLTYQHEIYEMMKSSNSTVVAIVHDINMAVRYADDLIFLSQGKVIANGEVNDCLDPQLLLSVLGHPVTVLHHPCSDCPLIVPQINQIKHHGKKRSLINQ